MNWEAEVRYNQMRRTEQPSPWAEMRRYRLLFRCSAALNLILLLLVAQRC